VCLADDTETVLDFCPEAISVVPLRHRRLVPCDSHGGLEAGDEVEGEREREREYGVDSLAFARIYSSLRV